MGFVRRPIPIIMHFNPGHLIEDFRNTIQNCHVPVSGHYTIPAKEKNAKKGIVCHNAFYSLSNIDLTLKKIITLDVLMNETPEKVSY